MIRSLLPSDFDATLRVINDAAQAYKGVIPDDRWKEPYISAEELKAEIETGVRFFGWIEDDHLLGVEGSLEWNPWSAYPWGRNFCSSKSPCSAVEIEQWRYGEIAQSN